MNIVRKTFPVGPLQCNCTVIGDTEAGIGYVFDPGGNALQCFCSRLIVLAFLFH